MLHMPPLGTCSRPSTVLIAALLIMTGIAVASPETLASSPYASLGSARTETTSFPGMLSGVWRGTLLFQAPPSRIDRFDTSLVCNYLVDRYRFGVQATMLDSTLRTVSLTGAGPVGEGVRIDSVLRLNAQVPSFEHWRTVTRFSLFDMGITHLFHLAGDPAASYMQLQARGAVDPLSYDSTTRFSVFPLEFAHHLVTLRGRWSICELAWEGQLRFTDEGLDYASVLLRDLQIPWPSSRNIGVYVNLETTFTVNSKTVTPTLTLRSTWECCVRGYLALDSGDAGDFSIFGVEVQGFEVRLTLEGAIELRTATSSLPQHNVLITGFPEYFEVWMLTGPIPPCCGVAPGRWQLAAFFSGTDELFGWGMTRFMLEFPVSHTTRLFSQLSLRAATIPWRWEWRVGWTVGF